MTSTINTVRIFTNARRWTKRVSCNWCRHLITRIWLGIKGSLLSRLGICLTDLSRLKWNTHHQGIYGISYRDNLKVLWRRVWQSSFIVCVTLKTFYSIWFRMSSKKKKRTKCPSPIVSSTEIFAKAFSAPTNHHHLKKPKNTSLQTSKNVNENRTTN